MSNFADEQNVSDYYVDRPEAEDEGWDGWTDEDLAEFESNAPDPWGEFFVNTSRESSFDNIPDEPPF